MAEKPISERMAVIEATQSDYERWNERQNGRLDKVDCKLDKIQMWLIGVLGSMVVSLCLLVLNLCI